MHLGVFKTSLVAAALVFACAGPALAKGTLRVAMTLADIPTLDGAPDQGTEGVRFSGYTVFDPLVAWDLSQDKTTAPIRPGLATEWATVPGEPLKWIFKLRQGVKFHDGSDFNADAVVFNLDRAFDKAHPAYDAGIRRQLEAYISSVKAWKKIDAYTIELTLDQPDPLLPYQLTRLMIASPAQWEKVGKSWAEFRKSPSGTGPWKLVTLVPKQRAEMVPNTEYWEEARRPKLDRLILLPIPEVSARTAALLSGRVDWAESPSPDTVARFKQAGIIVSTNAIPHMWPYTVSLLPGSPFADIRVRKAINLAIDRDGLVKVLNGLAVPSVGNVTPDSPWFGTPSFKIRYAPDEAKALLKEAGYGPDKPLKLKIAISTSGSGQMYPLMMNEFIQENLRQIGVDLQFEVFEWEALRGRRRAGAQGAENKGIDAINNSWNSMDPYNGILRFLGKSEIPPAGTNWGNITDPELDPLLAQMRTETDPKKQDEILAKLHTRHVDQANFIWIVHDVGSRALSPKVEGHVHAKSWFVDFSPISMK